MIKPEIINELSRRCDILIENSKKGELVTGMSGSLIMFRAALAPIGYPFKEAKSWMDEEYIKSIMTQEEFDNNIYEPHIKSLFMKAFHKVNDEVIWID